MGKAPKSDLQKIDPQTQARILSEALPHMQRYDEEIVVVKYGGHAMGQEQTARDFASDIVLLEQTAINPVVVHGGGPQIAAMLKKLGIKSEFAAGLRITDAATVEIVEMVLAGSINKQIVGYINAAGGVDVADDLLVDRAGQHHFDDLDGGGVGDAQAGGEFGLDAELLEHGRDLRAAAVHHHGIDRGLFQQHHVAREIAGGFLMPHGMAAIFDDDDFLVIALHMRQRLRQDARLRLWIDFGGLGHRAGLPLKRRRVLADVGGIRQCVSAVFWVQKWFGRHYPLARAGRRRSWNQARYFVIFARCAPGACRLHVAAEKSDEAATQRNSTQSFKLYAISSAVVRSRTSLSASVH